MPTIGPPIGIRELLPEAPELFLCQAPEGAGRDDNNKAN